MTRVLVVDDEPQLLRALRINLAARHYDVATAEDGAAALDAASGHPPDLVVLDLGLPDLDGVEVIRRLRAWTAVPIIVLSGRVGSSDKVLALDAGASLRTLQRLFPSQTGLALDAWRQKARLIQAVADLSAGAPVTTTAMDCGYDSVSAFIAAFKRQFGVTPGRYRPEL